MGAQGTATLDFGAFPGASDASVAVTGQGSITTSNLVEAWLYPTATGDHSADEHLAEPIKIIAGNIVNGTGFTIYGLLQTQPPVDRGQTLQDTNKFRNGAAPNVSGVTQLAASDNAPLAYGQWTVAWAWN